MKPSHITATLAKTAKTTHTTEEVVDLFHILSDEQENLIYDFLQWIADHGYIIEHSMGKWYYDGERIDNLDLYYKFMAQSKKEIKTDKGGANA